MVRHTGATCPRFEHGEHNGVRLQCEPHGEARNTQGGGVLAPGLENVANAIAFAREQFLQGEQPSGPIRHEIFTSWRRSALSGADPDIATFPYSSELDLDGRLTKAAYPVLDRLAERLESTGTAVLLADKDARILNRWAADPELLRMMDRSDSAPGFSLIEDVCGTNGLGSVVEERRPMYVCGAEHFAERFINYACYGAPIINPLTGRLEGAVTLVCNSVDASPLMMPFVQEMSGAIEDRLRRVRNAARAGAARRVHQGRPRRTPTGHRRQRQDDHHQPACVTTTRGRRARHPVGVRSRGDLDAPAVSGCRSNADRDRDPCHVPSLARRWRSTWRHR